MSNFDELINAMPDGEEEAVEEKAAEDGATYLQKHLIEIQNYLNEEIVTRKSISNFLGLLLAQSANYTFSLILISSGAEFFSSTIIGLIIGLTPGIANLTHINQKSNRPLERYLPVLVKTAIALFTTGVIFTQVTLPHWTSRQVLDQVYSDIELIEQGRPNSSILDNLKNSPLTPIALALFLITGFSMAQSKKY